MKRIKSVLKSLYTRQSPLGRIMLALCIVESLGSALVAWSFIQGVSTTAIIAMLICMSGVFLAVIALVPVLFRKNPTHLTGVPGDRVGAGMSLKPTEAMQTAPEKAGSIESIPWTLPSASDFQAEHLVGVKDDKEDSGEYAVIHSA